MRTTFLLASTPIIKSYEIVQKTIRAQPYPNILNFTNHDEKCATIEEFHKSVLKYSKHNGCILKGQIQRRIIAEPRAGTTNPETLTSWVCLDIDGVVTGLTLDGLLHDLGISNTDYIVQWSSSMRIPGYDGIRCHVFLLLDEPAHPATLKNWLKSLNFNTPILSTQIKLTKTGNALRWPLDITTCQNDKLIYIAPPKLGTGIADPYPGKNRITLHKKTNRTLTLPTIPILGVLTNQTEKKINELRKADGMAPRRFTTRTTGGFEYLIKPDTSSITGRRSDRGFVYFNLNGGDSWGYYHPEDNPDFILNFKGEPIYRTQDLLPDYWAAITKQTRQASLGQKDQMYLGFRERKSAKLFNAVVDNKSHSVELVPAASEKQLNDFVRLHGQPKLPELLDTVDVVFKPQSKTLYDDTKKTLNTYVPSQVQPKFGPWPMIRWIINHVHGNDQATYDRFINWLSCALQRRDNTGTAWIWHGTFGTGKGVMFTHILSPLFGQSNCTAIRMDELESQFNGFMWNKLLIFVDEMEQSESLFYNRIEAKLKNMITESEVSIRMMYRDARMEHNYTNMIFASNKPAPVMVRPDDRRFNVGMYQDKGLDPQHTKLDEEIIAAELPAFADFILNFKYDRTLARTPLINSARADLISTNMIAIDMATEALNAGDVEFFWDQLPNRPHSNPLQAQKYDRYKFVLMDIVQNQPITLFRDEIRDLFEYVVGGMSESSHKFASQLKHHRVNLKSVWRNGSSGRGVDTQWQMTPALQKRITADLKKGIP